MTTISDRPDRLSTDVDMSVELAGVPFPNPVFTMSSPRVAMDRQPPMRLL